MIFYPASDYQNFVASNYAGKTRNQLDQVSDIYLKLPRYVKLWSWFFPYSDISGAYFEKSSALKSSLCHYKALLEAVILQAYF